MALSYVNTNYIHLVNSEASHTSKIETKYIQALKYKYISSYMLHVKRSSILLSSVYTNIAELSPLRIAITSLGEERANLNAF